MYSPHLPQLDVSIIIPTLNRSEHIIKMMRYFNNSGFRGYVFIGDSSNHKHLERAYTAIKESHLKFEVVHHEYPNRKAHECIRDLLPRVTTQYAIVMNDDDILIPTGLERAVAFLDAHPDYSGAGGVTLQYQLKNPGAHGEIAWVKRYPVRSVTRESGSDRLLDLFNNYSVISYSLHRTRHLAERFPIVTDLTDTAFGLELFPTCMVAVQGKVHILDTLFVVRQMHEGRYLLPDTFDWVTKSDWQPSFGVFQNFLAEALVRQDTISIDEARAVVKRAFWDYLQQVMTKKFEAKYSPTRSHLQDMSRVLARGFRGATRIVQFMSRQSISLQRLLDPRSPHHNDFMPVYRVITIPPDEVR